MSADENGPVDNKGAGGKKVTAKKGLPAAPAVPTPGAGRRLAVDVAAYTGARIALVIALAGVIYLFGQAVGIDVPMLVAAFFAVIIALPAGMLLFKGLRERVNVGIASVDAGRKAQRANLTSRLRGDEDSGTGTSSGTGKP